MSVYMLRAGNGPVKIGTAIDIDARAAELQTGHYETLTVIRQLEGGRSLERWLHRHFKALQIRGEWFEYAAEMLTVQVPELAEIGRSSYYRALIERWPSLDDVAADARVTLFAVLGWRARDSIPGRYWWLLVCGAKARGINIGVEDFERALITKVEHEREDAA